MCAFQLFHIALSLRAVVFSQAFQNIEKYILFLGDDFTLVFLAFHTPVERTSLAEIIVIWSLSHVTSCQSMLPLANHLLPELHCRRLDIPVENSHGISLELS